jgi:uncharacterized membrane protein
MPRIDIGRWMLGLSSIGLGVVQLLRGRGLPWSGLIAWSSTSALTAYIVGAILIAAGVGLLARRFAAAAGLALGVGWGLLGLTVVRPAEFLSWYGVVEGISFGCGGWMLASAKEGPLTAVHGPIRRVTQAIFGFTLVFYGVSHFLLLRYTANLIPPEFPLRLALAEFTGAAHIAAGVALALGILPRLAATFEAAMLTSFGIIVQIPILVAKPAERSQWVEVLASFALAGAAWAVASAIKGPLWQFGRVARE